MSATVVLASGLAPRAFAQSIVAPPRPVRRAARGLGVHAFVAVEGDAMTAHQSFNAVLGSSTLTAIGGGGEVLGIWRGVFLRVEASSAQKTGSRVLVDGTNSVPLSIPITVVLDPVVFGGGWRQPIGRRRAAAVYAGAGIEHLVYRETSALAATGDNVDVTFNGFAVFGGVDVRLWRFVTAGAEAQFRSVPGALGDGGASKAFGETNLGSGVVRGLVGVRF